MDGFCLMDERSAGSWSRCLHAIQQKLQPQSFETWFAPITARELTSEEAVFEVPNSFFADWLEENYAGLIESTIQDVLAWKPSIAFAAWNRANSRNQAGRSPLSHTDATVYASNSRTRKATARFSTKPTLSV
jgi:chromosomal replication initiation ATPase DnaA